MISSAVTAQRPLGGEAAAVLAGAAGIGHEPVVEREQRIAMLEDLDRRVAAVGVARDLGVVAVLERGPARAHAVEVVVRVVAAGLRDGRRRRAGCELEPPLEAATRSGHRLGERREQQVDQLRLQVGVAADATARGGGR